MCLEVNFLGLRGLVSLVINFDIACLLSNVFENLITLPVIVCEHFRIS